MSNAVVSFNFVSHSVRVVMLNDEPWFVAADVCAALELPNITMALKRLDEDESQVIDFSTLNSIEGAKNQQLNPGQKINIINESGLYSLILTSRKPEAKKFKKWVTSEVLPAIRKTGRYEAEPPRPGIPDERWREILNLIHAIATRCHFGGRASEALHERIRWMGGVSSSRLLAPEQFGEIKAELTALAELTDQHFRGWIARDQEFIEQVLRPPVSVRKVRALVRRQNVQPGLGL